MKRRAKPATKSANIKTLSDFLWAAFDDYLAARVLIRANLLVQGAVLASTAIEKYCKAVLAFQGTASWGHLKTAHWNCLENFDPVLFKTFNPKLFPFLQKCYELRYPDSLPVGFSVVIPSRELLAELDRTAMALEPRFEVRLTKSGGDPLPRGMFEKLRKERDERLTADNHILSVESLSAFMTREDQSVYECRREANGNLLTAFYTTRTAVSDGNLLREGMRAKPDGRSFELAFTPSESKAVPSVCERCKSVWSERVSITGNNMTFLDKAPNAPFRVQTDPVTHYPIAFLFSACERCWSEP